MSQVQGGGGRRLIGTLTDDELVAFDPSGETALTPSLTRFPDVDRGFVRLAGMRSLLARGLLVPTGDDEGPSFDVEPGPELLELLAATSGGLAVVRALSVEEPVTAARTFRALTPDHGVEDDVSLVGVHVLSTLGTDLALERLVAWCLPDAVGPTGGRPRRIRIQDWPGVVRDELGPGARVVRVELAAEGHTDGFVVATGHDLALVVTTPDDDSAQVACTDHAALLQTLHGALRRALDHHDRPEVPA